MSLAHGSSSNLHSEENSDLIQMVDGQITYWIFGPARVQPSVAITILLSYWIKPGFATPAAAMEIVHPLSPSAARRPSKYVATACARARPSSTFFAESDLLRPAAAVSLSP